ncbi:MAG TPA: DUF5054 domain-containing protein [Rubrobacter sp.]|nr:DUF5054 domain-containing protein [Rubrobacter sp.]
MEENRQDALAVGEVAADGPGVDVVHLVFKTHLDVGFTDLAANVIEKYFDRFIPQAVEVAGELRRKGRPERLVWTTGSWLIYEYLERAAPDKRRSLEEAIEAGDVVWHGLPFTTHSELVDPGLFEYGLGLSRELDARFGRETIAAKMTDVPGHTRAIVPLLADAGIKFLHIGVNPGSTPPEIPPVFRWRDPDGSEVIVMYQRGGYGDLVTVPRMTEALAFAHTGDNRGPQSAEQIVEVFEEMRTRVSGARVVASTMDAFARALLAHRSDLPVVTGEIGDTWIHGVASDPGKISRYRELCRLRNRWISEGHDGDLAAFSRRLLMVPEHTWGLDEKTFLADYENYTSDELRRVRGHASFARQESSWAEQRAYVDEAIGFLDEEKAREAEERLAAIAPQPADKTGFAPVERSAVRETTHFTAGFDPENGALNRLVDKATGRAWASEEHPLGLFRHQTFTHEDYSRFLDQYIIDWSKNEEWAAEDYGKPGIERYAGEGGMWDLRMVGLYEREDDSGHHLLVELEAPEERPDGYGCPGRVTVGVTFPYDERAVYLDLRWFDKPACRLPEALWFTFAPDAPNEERWTLEKMGRWISPLEVVPGGNRKLHAVSGRVEYSDECGDFLIDTLDAPIVAPGEPSLLDFNDRQPPLLHGMHFNLYNNVWGTNFAMWNDDDARFRFLLRVE